MTARPPRPTGKGRTVLLAGAAALTAAAAAAAWNNAQARRAERDHPPRGRFLEVDGVRLHYLERGAGPPVVLLHGNVVTAEDYLWSGVLEQVAEHHRVVAIDRPGFGYSDRPKGRLWTPAEQASLLRRAFAQLGLDRPVVVGHSWGTLVALALALDHPEAVRGLVLLSGYYRPTVRVDVPLVAPPAIPVLGAVLRHTVSPLLGRALLPLNLKAMFAPLPVPDAFRRGFPYGFPVRPGQIRAESQDAVTMVPAVAAMRERYRDLHLPVTIMAGTHDRIVDVDSHAVWFHEAVPGSELRLVPEAGHMFHYAVPEQVTDAIAAVADGRRLSGELDPAGTRPTVALENRSAA
jgi:pimeloyl-ACP methyl ester carboxylesterase